MDMRAAITNVRIASDIGLDHTTVSRIRSGDRMPSLDVMIEIERVYKWAIPLQVVARATDDYAGAFERILISRFGVEVATATA